MVCRIQSTGFRWSNVYNSKMQVDGKKQRCYEVINLSLGDNYSQWLTKLTHTTLLTYVA